MGQPGPPPNWQNLDERVLERLFPGTDEDAARGALVELRRRHDLDLRKQAHRQCGGNGDLSAEALQQLDTRLWEKRKKYDAKKAHWIAWAKALLRNIIVDLFRQRSRDPSTPLPPPTGPDASPADPMAELPDPQPPPDRHIKLEELKTAMDDCLKRLRPEEREALILREQQGLSYENIGKQTGVPWETAGTRVHRAKLKMRECLKRKGFEGGEL
jgi:RNA polymerase sigma-70 factor, ECF subfamily